MTQILAGATLANGLNARFSDGYNLTLPGEGSWLSNMMEMGVPSTRRQEIYAYFESAPYPRAWKRGDAITEKAMESVQFSVTNFTYGLHIPWHAEDRDDDQTGSLFEMASRGGMNWGTLKERLFFEVLTGTQSELQVIPNAPDGAALFSTTDGSGADRFFATGGNIQTGTGVASGATVRADLWSALERFTIFKDTEGEPLWDRSLLDSQGYTVLYAAGNEEAFREAFTQGRTVDGGAAVTNTVLESGISFTLQATSRLAGTDWYVSANGAPHKAIFEQTRQDIEFNSKTMENSDDARGTKREGAQWNSRHGIGVWLPYQMIKVDNT